MFLEIEIIHKQDKANKQKEKCNSLLAVPYPEVTDCCWHLLHERRDFCPECVWVCACLHIQMHTCKGKQDSIANTVFSLIFHIIEFDFCTSSSIRMNPNLSNQYFIVAFRRLLICLASTWSAMMSILVNTFFIIPWHFPYNNFQKGNWWVSIVNFEQYFDKYCQIFSKNFESTYISSNRLRGNCVYVRQ